MHLVLVRHAESIWNAEHRWQGQSDVPLSERGRNEAFELAGRLAKTHFDAIFASDLSRARETAEAIVARNEAQPTMRVALSRGLREMDLGAWCGLPHAEVLARYPDDVDALSRGEDRPIGGTGESLSAFEARVHDALERSLATVPEARRVLVVTHGGCIRAVLLRLLGLRGRRRPLEGAGNTSLTTLRADRGVPVELLVYNDASHLESTKPHDGSALAGPVGRKETIVGPAGRARTCEVLALAANAPLAEPGDDASTELIPDAARLVRYGVPRSL